MLKSLKLALAVATGAAVLSLAGLATGSSVAGAATNQVRQLQVSNWFGFNEGPSGSLGNVTLVPGPASPPAGTGSAKLQVDSTGRASLGSNAYKGTPLSQITALNYWGYVVGGTTNQLVLTFDVTYDTTLGSSVYQGRLTFIPSSPPPANAWRHLNALTDGTWYGTATPGSTHCPQSSPCTWSQVLGFFPHAAVRNDPIGQGALLLRLGGPITGGATAYVDDLTVATGVSSTTTDFEAGGSITPTIGPSGSSITAYGYGFHPKAKVTVKYASGVRGHRSAVVCTAVADLTGAAQCTGSLPAVAGAPGAHAVTLKGRGTAGSLVYTDDFVLSS
jgi:hypothetical protein